MYFILLISVFTQDIQFLKKVTLDITPSYKMNGPSISLSSEGEIFYADYWENRVYKLNSKGQLEFEVGRPGSGPGEHYKPWKLCLVEDDSILLVLYGSCKLSAFNAKNGAFIKFISKFIPINGLLESGSNHFIGMGGLRGSLVKRCKMDGTIEKEWMLGPGWDASRVHGIKNTIAVDAWGNAYFSEGAYPEIWVAEPGQSDYNVWELYHPKYYQEVPDKPFSPSDYFRREKVYAYYESFSQIDSVFCFGEGKMLAVCWQINSPYPFSLDVYDLKTRELQIKDKRIPGRLVAVLGNQLIFLELKESAEEGLDDRHILHFFEYFDE